MGVDEASKQFTSVPVPKQLTVKTSTIPDAGMGVYSKEYIPKGTRCGPYRGTIVDKMDIGADVDTAYMWEVSLHSGGVRVFTQIKCLKFHVINSLKVIVLQLL